MLGVTASAGMADSPKIISGAAAAECGANEQTAGGFGNDMTGDR